jgi:hypothetical protein
MADAPLERAERASGGGDVLDEEEAAAGAQHPAHLGDHAVRIADAAQHQGGDHRVGGGVRQVEILPGALADLDLDPPARSRPCTSGLGSKPITRVPGG